VSARRLRLIGPAVALCLALSIAAAAHAGSLGSRNLHTGSRGHDVAQLQNALVTFGYRIKVDGIFGRLTRSAVRRYERAHRLRVDGWVSRREGRPIARAAARAQKAAAHPQPVQQGRGSDTDLSGPHVFPVDGPYSFGGPDNRFGASRGNHTHQGQDVLADEGTRVLSVSSGVVYWRAYQSGGAGNYIVVRGDDGVDYMYAHLRDPALPAPGDRLSAGDTLGYVGHTGAASASHLHFEMWKPPWQQGGAPFDPLPYLQRWASGG
jgi:murein DD-endopeptidase MepM/ murein hydrolase activator NlpD